MAKSEETKKDQLYDTMQGLQLLVRSLTALYEMVNVTVTHAKQVIAVWQRAQQPAPFTFQQHLQQPQEQEQRLRAAPPGMLQDAVRVLDTAAEGVAGDEGEEDFVPLPEEGALSAYAANSPQAIADELAEILRGR